MKKEFLLFPTLEAEITRANVTRKELADALNISEKTLYNKLTGATTFDIHECQMICSFLEKKTGRVQSLKNLFNIMS